MLTMIYKRNAHIICDTGKIYPLILYKYHVHCHIPILFIKNIGGYDDEKRED